MKINWATWIRKYMLESAREVNVFANFPYGLLITRILLFYSINLSAYPSVEVSATYDSRTFSSMGYVLVEDKWCRKESACAKAEPSKVSTSIYNPYVSLMKELKELKQWFKSIEKGIIKLQESSTKLLDLGKSTSFDISVVRLGLDGLKQEGVKLFSRVLSHMDSLKF
ncbi:hypothetical protein FXO38_13248 [Capsicum annuum]|nr:hypothetical protein FXO37_16958 [Capsicum annuum]KAF3658358.1 hypothetical protein FXO38_13248 [Capsicum annuum]